MMIQNLSGYLFFHLDNPEQMKQNLKEALSPHEVFGTIILADEGINLNLSVPENFVDSLRDILFTQVGLPVFELKMSPSINHPHKRFLIKLKAEIVTMGVGEIDPLNRPASYIHPRELKTWLDQREDFLLLDTRKGFEFEIGSFEKAINLDGQHFRDFPEEIERISSEWRNKKVVTFCTGGIRCEKGAPALRLKGFQNVLQLRGGILKYFEICGGAHWRGDCFVFDHRAAVRPDLQPVEDLECRSCATHFNPQENPKDVDGLSLTCPNCFYSYREQKRIQSQIRAAGS